MERLCRLIHQSLHARQVNLRESRHPLIVHEERSSVRQRAVQVHVWALVRSQLLVVTSDSAGILAK